MGHGGSLELENFNVIFHALMSFFFSPYVIPSCASCFLNYVTAIKNDIIAFDSNIYGFDVCSLCYRV